MLGIDPDLVIPDKSLSVYEGCIVPWRSEKMNVWLQDLINSSMEFDFPIHRPYKDLDPEHQELVWNGNKYFKGLNQFFEFLSSQTQKIQYRVMLSRYRGRTVCPDCHGTRLRKDAGYVKVGGKSLQELVLLSISELNQFFKELELTQYQKDVAEKLLVEVNNRLEYILSLIHI